MDSLPPEILNLILSKLDPVSLFQASNVCWVWRELSLRHTVQITLRERLIDRCRKGDRLSIIHSKFHFEWALSALRAANQYQHSGLSMCIINRAQKSLDRLNWEKRRRFEKYERLLRKEILNTQTLISGPEPQVMSSSICVTCHKESPCEICENECCNNSICKDCRLTCAVCDKSGCTGCFDWNFCDDDCPMGPFCREHMKTCKSCEMKICPKCTVYHDDLRMCGYCCYW